MQLINDLWNGNVALCEHCGTYDSEATHLLGLMERNQEILRDGLTGAQIELLQKYIDCTEEYLLRMLELAFCDGFCLEGKLIMEVIL